MIEDPFSLIYVPYWFVTQDQLKIQYDDDDNFCDDEIVEWCNEYKNRKTQNAEINKELMPAACYRTRTQNWSMTEDEKKRIKEMIV